MKKLLMILFVVLFTTTLVSAAWTKTYDPSTRTYKIYNNGALKETLTLISNTDRCGGDMICYATIQATFYENGVNSFNNLKFNDMKSGGEKTIVYHFKKNGIEYDGNDLVGTYTFQLTGIKNPEDKLDWVFQTRGGLILDEWAIWGVQFAYDDFNDADLNKSLWINNTAGAFMNESQGTLNLYCGALCTSAVRSIAFPNFSAVMNITVLANYSNDYLNGALVYMGVGDFATDCTSSKVFVNNNMPGLTWTNITLVKNDVNFFVYYNGVYNRTIGPFTDSFQICFAAVGGPASGNTFVKADYVYTTIGAADMSMDKNYSFNSNNLTVNATISANFNTLKNISIFFDGVFNQSVSVTNKVNSTQFNVTRISYSPNAVHNFYLFGCDTDNNCRPDSTVYFSPSIQIRNVTFDPVVFELTNNNYYLNVSFDPLIISSMGGTFIYNGVSYPTTVTYSNSTFKQFFSTVSVPSVEKNTSYPFFWDLSGVANSQVYDYKTQNYSQQVTNLSIDDCSSFTNLLVNFTFYDQDTQTQLLIPSFNNSIQLNFKLYNANPSSNIRVAYNKSKINSASICSSSPLQANTQYLADAQVFFFVPDSAGTGYIYVPQYYNLQAESVNNTNFPKNIKLFDLLNTNSQEFLIILKDGNYAPIDNAIIKIFRQYPYDGNQLIEAPLTDTDGHAIGHFVLNSVTYTFEIWKNGQFIYNFTNQNVFCANVATGDCEINLRVPAAPGETGSGVKDIGVTYSIDQTAHIITATYLSNDNQSHAVAFNLTINDGLYNTSVCYQSSVGFGGSIPCVVPSSLLGNSYYGQVVVDGSIQETQIFSFNPSSKPPIVLAVFLDIIIIIAMVLIGAFGGPVIALIMFAVGLVIIGFINVVYSAGVVGPASAIMWFLVGTAILLWRATKRE